MGEDREKKGKRKEQGMGEGKEGMRVKNREEGRGGERRGGQGKGGEENGSNFIVFCLFPVKGQEKEREREEREEDYLFSTVPRGL